MKNTVTTPREELLALKKQIEITEKKLDYTVDPRLTAALSYELLGLRARVGYLIESQKTAVYS